MTEKSEEVTFSVVAAAGKVILCISDSRVVITPEAAEKAAVFADVFAADLAKAMRDMAQLAKAIQGGEAPTTKGES